MTSGVELEVWYAIALPEVMDDCLLIEEMSAREETVRYGVPWEKVRREVTLSGGEIMISWLADVSV